MFENGEMDKKLESNRNYSLDVIRIIATVLIIFHHYQQVFNVVYPSGVNYYFGRFYFGNMVELFFILSGYFMTPYIPRIQNGMTFADFIKKRLIRLLPVIAIAATATEAVVLFGTKHGSGYLASLGLHVSLWGWFIDSIGIQSGQVLNNPFVNNPTWYVSVLIWCYVVFFMITWVANKIKSNPLWGYIGMIFAGFAINTWQVNLPFASDGTARGYIAFGGGCITKAILR